MKKFGVIFLKKLRGLFRQETLIVLAVGVFLVFVFSVLSVNPQQSAQIEKETYRSSQSLSQIFREPVDAPYKLATYTVAKFSPTIRLVRGVSFSIYVLACIALFYALKHWHTLQASILTTVAFATNSIVLATSRLGTPLISVMALFIFSGMLLWQVHSKSNKLVPVITLIALAALLYTPGAVWFLSILAIVYWNKFTKLFKNVKRNAVIIGSIISLIVISPLVLGFIRDTASLNEWLLLPETIDWSNVPVSILRVPSAFIYRMPDEPLLTVGRLPVFDISSGILFLIGLNAYRKKIKLDRTRVMIGSALVGIVVGALGQLLLAIVLLLPFAYSVIAAGIEYLLDEWYSVFPRNPFARSFGVLMVTSALLFSMYYQVTRFFVVWPQAPETRAVYDQSRIIDDTSSTDTIELENEVN